MPMACWSHPRRHVASPDKVRMRLQCPTFPPTIKMGVDMADTDPKPPAVELDQEARDLQLARIKAESRKAIAEASMAAGKALTPGVGADALRSTVDFGESGGSSLTTIVASEQLSRV